MLFRILSYIVADKSEIVVDTSKWKSVLIPRTMYEEVVAVAHIEGRTISGQLRFFYDDWKRRSLTKEDMVVIRAQVVSDREASEEAIRAMRERQMREELEAVYKHAELDELIRQREAD